MKSKLSVLYCAVFFIMILAPLVFMPLGDNQLAENRPLAPAPVLIAQDGFNLPAPVEAEQYLSDRFAGRTLMIDAYSHLIGRVFGVSSNDKVIMGRAGWLFFSETTGDFDGSAALDDGQMAQLIRYLLGMKQEAEERGQVFIIAVAPNKNTLYGEHMPPGYVRSAQPSNLERLLAVQELECIDLGAVLSRAQRETGADVYYRTDSHWNTLGARAAAAEIISVVMERLDMGVSDNISEVTAQPDNRGAVYITGDLARMLYPVNPPEEKELFYIPPPAGFSAAGRFRNMDDLHITTQSDGVPLRIAMYRDSFANSLIPYISSCFADVYYTRQTPVPMDRQEFIDADVIIFQIAERRLPELLG